MAVPRLSFRYLTRPLALFAILLGAALGISSGLALSDTIGCSHVEMFCQGTPRNDQIYAWENQNAIQAKDGRDQVFGYGGNDEIAGENDADELNGGEGFDFVFGHYGNDSYLVVGGGAGVYGQSQQDYLYGGVGEDYVQGDQGNDNMWGNDHNDVMYAEDGEADAVNANGGGYQPCYVDGYDTFSNCTPY